MASFASNQRKGRKISDNRESQVAGGGNAAAASLVGSAPLAAVESVWPSPARAWGVVFILTVALMLAFLDRQIIALLVGPIQADLGLSDFEISLLQGIAFASFFALFGLPFGRMADHRSRRGIIAFGLVAWSLATAACGLARGFSQLFLARMGVGFGTAAIGPAAYSMITDYFPRERLATALSVYYVGAYAGSGLALVVGGVVLDWATSLGEVSVPSVGILKPWQTTFIAAGLPGLAFVLAFFAVKEPARRGLGGEVLTQEKTARGPEVSVAEVLSYLNAHRRVYGLMFAGLAFHTMALLASYNWAPEFLAREYGVARGEIGRHYGMLIMLFAVPGLIAGGWLADKLEARGRPDARLRVIVYGVLGMIPSSGLYPLMPSYELALVMLAPAMFFAAVPTGGAVAAIQLITPNQMRGLVTAVYTLVIGLFGLAGGPSVIAAITDFGFADRAMLGWSLIIGGLSMLLSSALLVGLAKPHYRRMAMAED